MLVKWVSGRPWADLAATAAVCKVSKATVRRYCTPVDYEPRAGQPPGGGKALYDVWDAAERLKNVTGRPDRRR